MDVSAALDLFGLAPGATLEDVTRTYRELRKPLLKELNRYDPEEQPRELVEKLDGVETAFKILEANTPAPEARAARGDGPAGRTPGAGPTTGPAAFRPGAVLLNRYEIEAPISHRPEGDTYRVFDRVRGSAVALKVIDSGLVRNPRQRARLHRGVLAASRLNHPNLARVLDLQKMQHTYAVVQELPPGENLWELMYGSEAKRDRLNQQTVLDVTEKATRALAYAHKTMPHATLRPESIWVSEAGVVKVSDFGLSDLQRPLRDRRLSRSKLGTAYWAPEQYRDDVVVDERSDQYALALILYEILSGKPSVGRTARIRSFRRDYPRRFTSALERALSSKSTQRFGDMDELGYAAFGTYRSERAPPSAVALESILIPTFAVLALFAGFVLSPVGRSSAAALGDAVGRWQTAHRSQAGADRELRGLKSQARRLDKNRASLSESGAATLDGARTRLASATVETPAEDVEAIRQGLTEVMEEVMGGSLDGAKQALARATSALDALADLEPAPAEHPDGADLATLVRHQSADLQRAEHWHGQRRALAEHPSFASGYRKLIEAQRESANGDDAAAGRGFGEAETALSTGAEAAEAAVTAVEGFDPLAKTPGIPDKMSDADCKACFEILLGAPEALDADPERARVLRRLIADAAAAATADARWSVHPGVLPTHGYWTLEVPIGDHAHALGGTWRALADNEQRLRVTAIDGHLLAIPYALATTRGEKMPVLRDLLDALALAPQDEEAVWCAPRPGARLFVEGGRLSLTPGEQRVRDLLAPGLAATCVLVEGTCLDPTDAGADERIQIATSVARTWLRAHVAAGLTASAGEMKQVDVDAVPPVVHLSEPPEAKTLPAGEQTTLRAFVYDSNLKMLEIDGEPRTLDPEDLYVPIKVERTPKAGELTLRVRAQDEAGNVTEQTWRWTVR